MESVKTLITVLRVSQYGDCSILGFGIIRQDHTPAFNGISAIIIYKLYFSNLLYDLYDLLLFLRYKIIFCYMLNTLLVSIDNCVSVTITSIHASSFYHIISHHENHLDHLFPNHVPEITTCVLCWIFCHQKISFISINSELKTKIIRSMFNSEC